MEKRPLVVLLGESVLMDGVAVSLGDQRALDVKRTGICAVGLRERLQSLKPDLIVVELDTRGSQSIVSLLRDQPSTLLLGLDLTCSRVIVLNSHQHMTRTMNDLCQVVQAEVSQASRSSKGGGPST
ncbi:MAG: hypothetical protein ISS56_18220 [Anaerolineae bacterium]|nr:hypothetical protein [Anaerolineae bacterium]